jgi:hypothetical protein
MIIKLKNTNLFLIKSIYYYLIQIILRIEKIDINFHFEQKRK